MTSLSDHTKPVTATKAALRRAGRFNLWALIAAAAVFGVLAVKAQVLPAPSWQHPFEGVELHETGR